ncbi:MAG TPA: N-acetyltransferase [Terriglobales bacterium]|jgi:ribosomal-protein-alanine N-acetyltransferase
MLQPRPLSEADAPQLWRLDQQCFAPGIAYSQEEIRAHLRNPRQPYHRGIEVGEELAGFILTVRTRGRGHVITLDVAPSFRQRGIGRTLMAAAEQYHLANGATGMQLEVAVNNAGALAFYTRAGYNVIRTLPRYYSEDLDGLLLHKDFAA